MLNILIVGSGGFIGAVLRYTLKVLVDSGPADSRFPWATLLVNLLGCLLIGLLAGLIETRQMFSQEFRIFALIGVLGGFTTYSAFGFETFALLRNDEFLKAIGYVGAHLFAGLTMVWAGFAMVSK
jgi:CrcB protein